MNRRTMLKALAGTLAIIVGGCNKKQQAKATLLPSKEVITPDLRTLQPNTLEVGEIGEDHSFDYYIDNIKGNDANNGKSIASALATIGALPALTEGVRIGLAKGSMWREQLTITANHVHVGSFGKGDRPIIECRDILSNDGWERTDGQTFVYERIVSFDTGVKDAFVRVWQDGIHMAFASSIADCNAMEGSYYIATHTTSPQTLYIHPTGNGDPRINGEEYLYNPRAAAIHAQLYSEIQIEGIQTVGNLSGDGSIQAGTYAKVIDCAILHGGKHSLYVNSGSIVDRCTLVDIYAPITGSQIVINANTPAGEGATISNCNFSLSSNNQVGAKAVVAILSHNNVSGSFGTINITGCTFTNFTIANGGFNDFDTINFSNNVYTNCKYIGGEASRVPSGGCIITRSHETWTSNISDQRAASCTVDVEGLQIIYDHCTFNVFNKSDTGYVFVNGNSPITIRNCIFNCSLRTSGAIALYITKGDANVTFTNNTMMNQLNYCFIITEAGSAATWMSDYNTFPAINSGWYINAVVYENLTAYQTATGQDSHSTVG